ncbi:hypothetical protein N7G274_007412 [Stereocaulon virgatum]|uniref:Phospholipid/glycerol acyltransferase domain-containing protein n=1 Tax=Stereocaulon virgatum TaxID=373712 RepID=A0ABR4A5G0_9LECA
MSSRKNYNGGPTMKLDKEHTYPEVKEGFLQATPVPEAATSKRIGRMALLITYFCFGCFAIAPTQYLGAPLYVLNRDLYYRYMAWTKRQMTLLVLSMTQWWTTTKVHVSGDESVRDQLHQLSDGRLQCGFASRLVLIANHQMYNDWVYLWWTAYTNQPRTHGNVFIVLKDSIKYIPIVGLGLRFAGFVFMSRKMKKDGPRLTRRLNQLTRRGPNGLAPMWLMMFPEGTNLSRNGRAKSVKWAGKQGIPDLQYQLIPRSTGTYFCLKALEGTLDWVYDCTLAYDGVPEGQYGQDVYTLGSTYLDGHPPPIHMHWRCFQVSDIPLTTLEEFDAWLQRRWLEKEEILAHHAKTGYFPSALAQGRHITTEVKLRGWWELWQFWVVLLLVTVAFSVLVFGGKQAAEV